METNILHNEHWKSEIARFLKGELTNAEEILLHKWVDENIEHTLFFEEIRNTWVTSVIFESNTESIDKKWLQMRRKLDTADQRFFTGRIQPFVSYSFKRIAGIAAMLIVAMMVGAILSRVLSPENLKKTDEVCEMITPLGSKSQVVLPDGTQVWLNAGSKLTYKKTFNEKDRMVSLQGEAFFHVKTNKSKPFIVKTSKINIKALGTSFNVKAYAEDRSVTATLVEGLIQVDGKGANAKPFTIVLKPKETITCKDKAFELAKPTSVTDTKKTAGKETIPEKMIQIAEGVIVKENISTIKFTSWKDPQWLIEAENMETLSVLLGRRFNVVIHNQTPSLREYRFTGTIRNETLEQVLEILRYTTPLKYSMGKGEVWWNIDPLLQDDYSKVLVDRKIHLK